MGRIDTLGSFILTCKHTVSFRTPWPVTGQRVICIKCPTGQRIVERIKEYTVNCDECRYRRSFGLDAESARRRAAYHVRMRFHAVSLYQGDTVIDRIRFEQPSVIYL